MLCRCICFNYDLWAIFRYINLFVNISNLLVYLYKRNYLIEIIIIVIKKIILSIGYKGFRKNLMK